MAMHLTISSSNFTVRVGDTDYTLEVTDPEKLQEVLQKIYSGSLDDTHTAKSQMVAYADGSLELTLSMESRKF